MQFQDELAGGIVLIRPALQSPDYQAGASGWRIAIDGSAEFNDVVIRGGTTVSGTALYYDGPPGPGTLFLAISAQDGTDPYGNPYRAGLTVGAADDVQASLVSENGAGRLQFPHQRPSGQHHATILSAVINEGAPGEYYTLQMLGPTVLASPQSANIQVNSPNADASSNANIVMATGSAGVRLDQDVMLLSGQRLAVTPTASASPAAAVTGAAGHTGHLLQVATNTSVVLSVGAGGQLRARPPASADAVVSVEAATGHTGHALQVAGAGEVTFTVSPQGVITQYANNDFSTFTPTVTGAGAATWTTRTGWYQRVGPMVYVCIYLLVNTAGSGATLVGVDMPTDVYRGTRQTLTMHTESTGPNGSHIGSGNAVFFAGGTGATTDRLRTSSNDGTNRDLNITGADLLAGGALVIEGWYREGP